MLRAISFIQPFAAQSVKKKYKHFYQLFLARNTGIMSRPTTGKAVVVNECSDDVFKAANIETIQLPALASDEVLVKMLAAPINPSDTINIAGYYGLEKASCPFVVGFEGVGEINEIGGGVKDISVGDWIIPNCGNFGTWRDYGIYKSKNVAKIDKRIGYKAAATMMLNPTSAYFLLHDIVKLQQGDAIIQNGANGYVGKALIQIAKAKGIKTINIVRKRANLDELVKELKSLGADDVVTDEELKSVKFDKKPVLGIDCVGGDAGLALIDHLDIGGTLVSYGAMSGKPIPANPLDLVFRQIKICGFWVDQTLSKQPGRFAKEAVPYISKLTESGKFKLPEFDLFLLDDFKKGMERAKAGFANKKQLLVMDQSLMK